MRNDLPPRDRYDELSNAWRHTEDRSLVAPPPPPRARRNRRSLLIAVLAVPLLIFGFYARRSPEQAPASGVSMGEWSIEMESAGSGPLTALAYGPETGVHLVKVSAPSASNAEKRTMTARLDKGQVRMISLGRSSLRIKATSPGGAKSDFIVVGARGRIITLTRSGVRTGW